MLASVTETVAGYAFARGDVDRTRCGRNHDRRREPGRRFFPQQASAACGSYRGGYRVVGAPSNHQPGACVTSEVSNFCASIFGVSSRKTLNQSRTSPPNLNHPSLSLSPRMKTLRPLPAPAFVPLSTLVRSDQKIVKFLPYR